MTEAVAEAEVNAPTMQLVTFGLQGEICRINVMQAQEFLTETGRDKDWQLAGRRG